MKNWTIMSNKTRCKKSAFDEFLKTKREQWNFVIWRNQTFETQPILSMWLTKCFSSFIHSYSSLIFLILLPYVQRYFKKDLSEISVPSQKEIEVDSRNLYAEKNASHPLFSFINHFSCHYNKQSIFNFPFLFPNEIFGSILFPYPGLKLFPIERIHCTV